MLESQIRETKSEFLVVSRLLLRLPRPQQLSALIGASTEVLGPFASIGKERQ